MSQPQSTRYYGGDASDLGHVRLLSQRTFRDLVDQVLNMAVTLNVTREQYASMDKQQRMAAKRVPYVVPCTFDGATSPRLLEHARAISLLCLDVDDPRQAAPFLSSPEVVAEQLMPFSFAVHTTASSTPEAPRVRVLVDAAALPVDRYADAVTDIARRLGLPDTTRESRVPVQPMYLPTLFRLDTQRHPLLITETSGRPYDVRDLPAPDGLDVPPAGTPRSASPDGDDTDLDLLRNPVDNVTLADVAAALQHLDPDCVYAEWLDVAAALRHQFPSEPTATQAYELFDEWSSGGSKYVSTDDTGAKWHSLRPTPRGRAPITIRTVLMRARASGWNTDSVHERLARALMERIRAYPDATLDHLLREGVDWIAATPLLTKSEEDAALNEIVRRLSRASASAKQAMSAYRAALKAHPAAVRKAQRNGEPVPAAPVEPQGVNDGIKISTAALRKDLRMRKSLMGADRERKEQVPDWARGMCYVAHVNQFFRQSTGEILSPEALDRAYGAKLLPSEEQLREAGDTSLGTRSQPILAPQDYLLNVVQIPRVYDYQYDPGQPNDVFITYEGKQYVNTYVRNYPEPDPLRCEEAGAIITEHLERQIEDPSYRASFIQFLAHLVQRPGQKIRWAVLLQGAEGCGKSFWSEMEACVLGPGHVRPITGTAIRGDWNEWATGTQLVALEEVRVAGQNRHEVMNKLKDLVTNTTVNINQKMRDSRVVPNRTNYLLFTNYHDALAVTSNDRRYLVLKCRQQTKEQVAAMGGRPYFARLFGLLRDNPGGVRAWLEQVPIDADFPTDGPAPLTRFMEDLVRDSASEPVTQLRELLEDEPNPLVRRDVLSSVVLGQLLNAAGSSGQRISTQYVAAMLRDEGYVSLGRRTLQGGAKHTIWARADDERSHNALRAEFIRRAEAADPEALTELL